MVCIAHEVLFNNKEEGNYNICRKMDGTEGHHGKQNKPSSVGHLLQISSQMWTLVQILFIQTFTHIHTCIYTQIAGMQW